jgi:hypothetical protein
MKHLTLIIILFLCTVFIFDGVYKTTAAASLDFGWGPPIDLKQEGNTIKSYLVWPIQISNRTGRRLVPHLDIVAVTNTGRQFSPLSTVKITGPSSYGVLTRISDLCSNLFPSAMISGMAVFGNMDPKVNGIDFYVGGLIVSESPVADERTYLRITYKRTRAGWEWEDTGVLK